MHAINTIVYTFQAIERYKSDGEVVSMFAFHRSHRNWNPGQSVKFHKITTTLKWRQPIVSSFRGRQNWVQV